MDILHNDLLGHTFSFFCSLKVYVNLASVNKRFLFVITKSDFRFLHRIQLLCRLRKQDSITIKGPSSSHYREMIRASQLKGCLRLLLYSDCQFKVTAQLSGVTNISSVFSRFVQSHASPLYIQGYWQHYINPRGQFVAEHVDLQLSTGTLLTFPFSSFPKLKSFSVRGPNNVGVDFCYHNVNDFARIRTDLPSHSVSSRHRQFKFYEICPYQERRSRVLFEWKIYLPAWQMWRNCLENGKRVTSPQFSAFVKDQRIPFHLEIFPNGFVEKNMGNLEVLLFFPRNTAHMAIASYVIKLHFLGHESVVEATSRRFRHGLRLGGKIEPGVLPEGIDWVTVSAAVDVEDFQMKKGAKSGVVV